jgi:hypothetical protein
VGQWGHCGRSVGSWQWCGGAAISVRRGLAGRAWCGDGPGWYVAIVAGRGGPGRSVRLKVCGAWLAGRLCGRASLAGGWFVVEPPCQLCGSRLAGWWCDGAGCGADIGLVHVDMTRNQ